MIGRQHVNKAKILESWHMVGQNCVDARKPCESIDSTNIVFKTNGSWCKKLKVGIASIPCTSIGKLYLEEYKFQISLAFRPIIGRVSQLRIDLIKPKVASAAVGPLPQSRMYY